MAAYAEEDVGQGEDSTVGGSTVTLEVTRWFLRKLGINLPQESTIHILGMYVKDASSNLKDTCLTVFIKSLVIIARNWKQPSWSTTEKWMKKM